MYGRTCRRQRNRFRSFRRTRLIAAAAGLVLTLFGVAKLTGYGLDLLSSRGAAGELRQVSLSASTLEAADRPGETAALPPAEALKPPEEEAAPAAQVPPAKAPPQAFLAAAGYPGNPALKVSGRFEALRKKNGDVAAWLKAEGLLDEPVVLRDNAYYLNHDVSGRKNSNGALFLDASIPLTTRPFTYVVYGHNMKSGAMFGCLRNLENPVLYHGDPFLSFDTLYEEGRFVIFAVGTVSIREGDEGYLDFYALRSASVAERQRALSALEEASVFTAAVDVRPEDQWLILVTCVDSEEERRVVAARRLREGETEEALRARVLESRRKGSGR